MLLETRVGGRIHFGLVDLTGATPRTFGGIGAMLADPVVRVTGKLSSQWTIAGLSEDVALRRQILASLRSLQLLTDCSCAALRIQEMLPRHHGLGSGTSTILSSLAAANAICGAGLSQSQLVQLSGRGGASGTGVNGFWHGGWIVDCGQVPRAATPKPSGSLLARQPSMMVQRISPPPWALDVYVPPMGRRVSGAEEEAIFREAAAGRRADSLDALAILYHGLVPALLGQDLDAFGHFMTEFQSRGLKRLEIDRQHSSVRSLLQSMRTVYPCVAMSSMGPALVGIREKVGGVPKLAGGTVPSITTRVDGEGVRLTWVE